MPVNTSFIYEYSRHNLYPQGHNGKFIMMKYNMQKLLQTLPGFAKG